MKKVLFLSFFLTSTNSFAEPIPNPVVEAIQRDTIAWMKKNGWSKKSSRNPHMLLEDSEELIFDLHANDNYWGVGEETINDLNEKQAADTSRSHVLRTDRSDHEHEISLNLNNLNSNEDEVKQLYEAIESLRENNHALQMWCAERQQELQNAAEENERLKDIIQMKEDLHNTKEQQIENRETEIATLQDKIRILEKNEQTLNTKIEDVTKNHQISKTESMQNLQEAEATQTELQETITELQNAIEESKENIAKLKDEKELIIELCFEKIDAFNGECTKDYGNVFWYVQNNEEGIIEWIEAAAKMLLFYMKQEKELPQKVLELDEETYDTEAIQEMKAAVNQYVAFQEEYKKFAEKMSEQATKRDEALNAALQKNAALNNELELYKQGFAEALKECNTQYENKLLEYHEQIVDMQNKCESAPLGLESNLDHNNHEDMCAELEEENAILKQENAALEKKNAEMLEYLQEREEKCDVLDEDYNTLIEYVQKIENIEEKVKMFEAQQENIDLQNRVQELKAELEQAKQNQNTEGDTEKTLTKQESVVLINHAVNLFQNTLDQIKKLKNNQSDSEEEPELSSSVIAKNTNSLAQAREQIHKIHNILNNNITTLVKENSRLELKAADHDKTLAETKQQIEDQNKKLQKEQTKNLETIEALKQENERLKKENRTQHTQEQEGITQLKAENELIKTTQQELEKEKEALLKDKNCVLQKENSIQATQEEEITQLKKENESLNKQHKEHKAQIENYQKQLKGDHNGKSRKCLDESLSVIEKFTKLSSTTKVSDESVQNLLRDLTAKIKTAQNQITTEISAIRTQINKTTK